MWFAVLPDGEAASAAARALRPHVSRVVDHASGRPWLMGCWPDGALMVAAAGEARAVVAGDHAVTAAGLGRRLARARSVADVGPLSGLPGCHHLVVSLAGQVRVQGTLGAVRRVFHARAGKAMVAASHARVLACLTGADWDQRWLAVRLSSVAMPYPLQETVPWCGVEAVPADHWLRLDADGSASAYRRWSPPDAELTLAEGAPVVRAALAGAVGARTAAGGTVSTDLSGGMDSTTLAFLAAAEPVDLVTYRWAERDTGNDDARYARLAAARLPRARHVVDPKDGVAMFAGLGPDAAGGATWARGEPPAWVRSAGRIEHIARAMAAQGSRLHLAGHGGDELFRPGGHGHLRDLAGRRPLTALRRARGYRALARASWPAVAKALTDRRTPARELRWHADHLTDPLPVDPRALRTGWTWSMRMPEWASPDAVAAARSMLRNAAEAAHPLAPGREQHQVLMQARSAGVIFGPAADLTAAVGARLTMPYLDDAVIEAALAVRPEDRNQPGRYKPLLVEAARGILPRPVLERTTKGEFSADFYQGLERHRAELLALLEDSALARYGLIDTAICRQALLRPHPTAATLMPLDATLACEIWLRAQQAGPPGPDTVRETAP
ncbi:asparagine synthase-related protein [Streptomyces palmae]|uniref:asparagine synthase (glutamine-hydrolyzing) n=1 Tax=Streptomyces palmae TaxID=1701085 RepID=A0A4Z0H623_9ACTN|nr:asparagine synthase-related protein [Streptomyces palmae]TGB07858.1 asparagine synthase [Streptomyces palmae]